jgi:hypothetical protein
LTTEQLTFDSPPPEFPTALWRSHFRTRERAGLVAVTTDFNKGKLGVDIVSYDPATNKKTSSSFAYVNALGFTAYLRSVVGGTGRLNYPANEKTFVNTDEGFTVFGGGKDPNTGNTVSRQFKSHYWQVGETYDDSSFIWKVAHFPARIGRNGAVVPNPGEKPTSYDTIRVTRAQFGELLLRVELALHNFVLTDREWPEKLNGSWGRK